MSQLFGSISLICFLLSIIAFAITIYIYLHFNIKHVYNFLNGKTALEEIKQIKDVNKINQNQSMFVDYVDKQKTEEIHDKMYDEKTTVLENDSTTLIQGLDTTVLNSETLDLMYKTNVEDIHFIVEEEIKVVHTKYVI